MSAITAPKKQAVVLLSGGLDSTTAVAIAKYQGFGVRAITFRYGQRHAIELESARQIAAAMDVEEHLEVDIDMRRIGGSALTDEIEVPKHESASDISSEIPVTYVPARNTVFLSFALAWAERLDCSDIFVGVNALDYSGYPDCRPEYIKAFEQMANLATKAGVEGRRLHIHAPLLHLTKAQIIQRGTELGVDYSMTSSCYDPTESGEACGRCDSCLLRLKGFRDAGLEDPRAYASGVAV